MKFKEIKNGMIIHCPKEENVWELLKYLKAYGYITCGIPAFDNCYLHVDTDMMGVMWSGEKTKDAIEFSSLIEFEPRFKVGDKVKVRNDLKVGEVYGGILCKRGMQIYAGKVKEVIWVNEEGNKYRLDDNPLDDFWSDEMLEQIVDSDTDSFMTAEDVVHWLSIHANDYNALEKIFGSRDIETILISKKTNEIINKITLYEATNKTQNRVDIKYGWHCIITHYGKVITDYNLWGVTKEEAESDATNKAIAYTSETGKATYAAVYFACRIKDS